MSGDDWSQVFNGPEPELLASVDKFLQTLPAGVLITWNGARFDLPFISDRAAHCGVPIGLRIVPNTNERSVRDPLPGHDGGYLGTWHTHQHLDAYAVYRADVGASIGMPCGLKPLARLFAMDPIEVDSSAIHELSTAEIEAYVASDAQLARDLALRRWPTARLAIDRVPNAS